MRKHFLALIREWDEDEECLIRFLRDSYNNNQTYMTYGIVTKNVPSALSRYGTIIQHLERKGLVTGVADESNGPARSFKISDSVRDAVLGVDWPETFRLWYRSKIVPVVIVLALVGVAALCRWANDISKLPAAVRTLLGMSPPQARRESTIPGKLPSPPTRSDPNVR